MVRLIVVKMIIVKIVINTLVQVLKVTKPKIIVISLIPGLEDILPVCLVSDREGEGKIVFLDK